MRWASPAPSPTAWCSWIAARSSRWAPRRRSSRTRRPTGCNSSSARSLGDIEPEAVSGALASKIGRDYVFAPHRDRPAFGTARSRKVPSEHLVSTAIAEPIAPVRGLSAGALLGVLGVVYGDI